MVIKNYLEANFIRFVDYKMVYGNFINFVFNMLLCDFIFNELIVRIL